MKIFYKIILFICFALIIEFVVYLYTENKVKEDYQSYIGRINHIFKGANEITDYLEQPVNGELINMKNTEGEYMRKKVSTMKVLGAPNSLYKKIDLFDYFECDNGGWNIYQLQKIAEGSYIRTSYSSTNMGYKVPKYNYVSGENGRYYTTTSYYKPTFRGSIDEVYEIAKLYILKNKIINFEKGSINRIISLENIKSDFHKLKLKGSIEDERVIQSDKTVVGYKEHIISYTVILDNVRFQKHLYMCYGIGLIGSIIFSIIIFIALKLLKK